VIVRFVDLGGIVVELNIFNFFKILAMAIVV